MVSAWYMNDDETDQRLSHKKDPSENVTEDKLKQLGVDCWFFDPSSYQSNPEFLSIKNERGYTYQDMCEISPKTMPNYEEKIKSFYDEHIHMDDEIRYCLEGSGYFDVRDLDDRWIRIELRKGDMIVLPAGMYHRFTLDTNNYIKALRLFVGEPVWTPYSRAGIEANHPSVQHYLQAFGRTQRV